MTAYDAIVVGARCAGSATAMLLAQQGLRVLALDRARYGSDTVSTHALMRGGVLQLQRWGLIDRVVAAGTPPITRVLFHYPDETVPISLKPAAGVHSLYAPRRTVLDRILADAAMEAGADVRFQTTVTDVLRHGAGRVTGIAARDDQGRAFVASAPITIGADGLRSTIARSVDAPIVRRASGGSAALYGYWDDFPAEGYEWFYAPGTAAGLVPTNDGQTLVFVGTTIERMRALRSSGTGRAFTTLLDAVSPSASSRVTAARSPRHLRGFAGVPGYLRQAGGTGWALVGDAGAWEDQLSTHGITDAFRDADLLAGAVRKIRTGSLSEAEALDDYQATRDRMAGPLFGVVEPIASFGWTTTTLRRLLLEASSAMTEQVEGLQELDVRESSERLHIA
ncbi:MAG TPA: NAD(P)/FAD-dependent oxidoreductase [Jiangellaceae bacterium]|nr:NAD(P)/FAD-dependent oxidoreductase [Jiangellaceae bacterium]